MHFDFSHKLLINARRKTFYGIKYVHQAAVTGYFYGLIFYSKCCKQLFYLLTESRNLKSVAVVTKA